MRDLRLALIRHGATQWNASRRFQGRSDVPLSDEGRAQARALAAALAGERFDAVYASDLVRAFETARIVAEPHRLAVVADERLREFDFGAWEGLTWDEIVASRPHLQDTGRTLARRYAPEGGETFEAVRARVGAFFDGLGKAFAGRSQAHVAVVMHAGPLHAALEVLRLDPPRDGPPVSFAAASLTRVAMEAGRPRLISLGDVRHLDTTRRP
ncbi:MAG TPA: histidine phosphatase family protein [Verrucomicrobiae bacterium]|nr:histidine phosphatase family protein [Verrucomicrobiae bacterium]